MTPYLIKVQDPEVAEDQLCCVLLAEKVHSGYEGNPFSRQKVIWFHEIKNCSVLLQEFLCSSAV